MTATTTAGDIGTVAGTVIDTALDTGLVFLSNSTLITALMIGGVALFFLSRVRKWL